jgi:hypothetical protein
MQDAILFFVIIVGVVWGLNKLFPNLEGRGC